MMSVTHRIKEQYHKLDRYFTIYIYIYIYVCVCVCVCEREREREREREHVCSTVYDSVY